MLTGEVDVLHRRVAKSSIFTDRRRFGMGMAAFSLNLDFSLLNREADVLHRRGKKKPLSLNRDLSVKPSNGHLAWERLHCRYNCRFNNTVNLFR